MTSSRFTMRSSGPPAGHHQVEFVRIEEFEGSEKTKDYGAAVQLVFNILAGDHAGEEIFVVCSTKLSQKSKLGGYAVALNGGPISLGQEVDFASYYGRKGLLVVEENADGTTKPTSFLKT